ncbi:SDR family oxidoreductase [Niabella terrae]
MATKTFALITGAGAGLGKAFAVECAGRGYHLILIALPGSRLNLLSDELSRRYGIQVVYYEFDMTRLDRLLYHINLVKAQFPVSLLINNAGMGGTASILTYPVDLMDKTIQLNIRSSSLVTRSLLPVLMRQPVAYIINISSMAAFTPIAYKVVYPATKAFLTSFSLGLREELATTGVSVSVACPGPMMTNAGTAQRILLQGLKAKLGLMPTTRIAQLVLKKAFEGKAIIVPGRWNAFQYSLMKWLPLSFKTKTVSRQIRKELIPVA